MREGSSESTRAAMSGRSNLSLPGRTSTLLAASPAVLYAALCVLLLSCFCCTAGAQTTVFVDDLRQLCGGNASAAVQQVSGCKLWLLCDSALAKGPNCDPAKLLATACLDAANTDLCRKTKAFCDDSANKADCANYQPLAAVLTTAEAYADAQEICTSHTMDGCQYCSAASDAANTSSILAACPDPLGTLSYMCLIMDMTTCDQFNTMCTAQGIMSTFPTLCKEPMPPSSSAPPTGEFVADADKEGDAPAAAPKPSAPAPAPLPSQAQDKCITNSSMADCADYQYPDTAIRADINHLCDEMSNMAGCTIDRSCNKSGSTGGACAPFSILGDLCTDMPTMKGCQNWVGLCGSSSSVVKQCQQSPPMAHLVKTMAATDAVLEMCGSHSMMGCDTCTDKYSNCPDPLKTLSTLCWEMSGMQACTPFYTMCSSGDASVDVPDLCEASSNQGIPPMTMWFHQRVQEVILFREWIPRTTSAYVASWFACFFMAVAAQAFKALRTLVEVQWVHRDKDDLLCHCGDEEYAKEISRIRVYLDWGAFKRNFVRSLFTGVTVTLEYWLMLVAMIFNIGLFVAVVTGYMLGALLFGHVGEAAHAYLSRLPKVVGSETMATNAADYSAPPIPSNNEGCHSHCV